MSNQKHYKVVDKKLKSMNVEHHPILSIQYKVGEFIRGKLESGLFVFDSLENARHFVRTLSYWPLQIYEAEVKQSVRPIFVGDGFQTNIYKGLITILKRKKNKKRYLHLIDKDMPEGTKCFKQVKLIKRVK